MTMARLKKNQRSSGMDARRRLQMADIARMAGVSTSTVSRALAGSPLVNEETRLRVADLARSVNYSINLGAQNLRLQQNRTVSVVVPYEKGSRQHITDPFFLQMLGVIGDALTERGFDMLLTRVDAAELRDAAKAYEARTAVGVILIGQWHHHEVLNELAGRRIPLIVWGARLPQQLYCTIGGDNVVGGSAATEHLLSAGCRRIVFVGDTGLPEVAQRYEGYRRAHLQQGITAGPELLYEVPFLAAAGRKAIHKLIADKIQFDAIFACSDLLAMTAISTLREHGLGVPQDVCVVGYDDIDMAEYFNPPLTTIRQSIANGGTLLVDKLFELLDGAAIQPIVVPTELVVRATTRRVRSR